MLPALLVGLAGAAIGSAVPGLGTAAGGVVGGLIGALGCSFGGSAAAKVIADRVADDDSKPLVTALQDELQELAFEFMLTEEEVNRVGDEASKIVKPKWLRQLYKKTEKGTDQAALRSQIREEFEPQFESIVLERPMVMLPQVEDVEAGVACLVEDLEAAEIENDEDS